MSGTSDKTQFLNLRFTFEEFYFRTSGALRNKKYSKIRLLRKNPLYGILCKPCAKLLTGMLATAGMQNSHVVIIKADVDNSFSIA